jgi:hypothetical protein
MHHVQAHAATELQQTHLPRQVPPLFPCTIRADHGEKLH